MPGHHVGRMYARVLIVGVWGILVGGVTVFVATRLLDVLPTTGGSTTSLTATDGAGNSPSAVEGSDSPLVSSLALAPLFAAMLGGLLKSGVAGIAVGGLLVVLGARLCATTTGT